MVVRVSGRDALKRQWHLTTEALGSTHWKHQYQGEAEKCWVIALVPHEVMVIWYPWEHWHPVKETHCGLCQWIQGSFTWPTCTGDIGSRHPLANMRQKQKKMVHFVVIKIIVLNTFEIHLKSWGLGVGAGDTIKQMVLTAKSSMQPMTGLPVNPVSSGAT
jgi:hypothetical protein